MLTILVVRSMNLDDHDTYVCSGYRDPCKFRWVGYSLADLDSNGHIYGHQSICSDAAVGEEMSMITDADNNLIKIDADNDLTLLKSGLHMQPLELLGVKEKEEARLVEADKVFRMSQAVSPFNEVEFTGPGRGYNRKPEKSAIDQAEAMLEATKPSYDDIHTALSNLTDEHRLLQQSHTQQTDQLAQDTMQQDLPADVVDTVELPELEPMTELEPAPEPEPISELERNQS